MSSYYDRIALYLQENRPQLLLVFVALVPVACFFAVRFGLIPDEAEQEYQRQRAIREEERVQREKNKILGRPNVTVGQGVAKVSRVRLFVVATCKAYPVAAYVLPARFNPCPSRSKPNFLERFRHVTPICDPCTAQG